MHSLASILANIYSAPLDPDKWTIVLDELAKITDSRGSALLVERGDGWAGWRTSPALEPQLSTQILARSDTRRAIINTRLKSANSSEFIPDHLFFNEAEWLSTPFMKEYGIPNGLKHSAGTFISTPTGDEILIFVIRDCNMPQYSNKEIDVMNELRPHLARAAMLTIFFGLTKLETMVDTIEKMSQPVFIVDLKNYRIWMQRHYEVINKYFSESEWSGIRFRDNTQRQSLKEVIKLATDQRRSISQPIKSIDGDPAVMHILPVESLYVSLFDMRNEKSDYFQHSFALIYLSLIRPDGEVNSNIIRCIFDLTNAETKIAESITSGRTIDETAVELNISRETVRTHLKRIYSKLGINRQAQLVSLVAGITKTGRDQLLQR